ncbi:hypothetical protein L1987_54480 [Smallanthus sonchifolius]|uniref:Uncharacterized protein n=1 Tax=Smallanthus sonchifolius TaxID=185202 RepID=A0ACB9E8A5_9ASTR|nr:hypothetical protein L1987_54480 [Smallanthus sonchifolius]
MGFERLLKLKMDGIPAKMGHFVVDSFCPKKMQINVEKHKININCEAIHQLLGVPCGDVTIESMGKFKKGDESVRAWRNKYTLLYVDSIKCKGIKMDKNTNPIRIWNMSRLKERQKWEIENGGFGKGKFKRLSKVIVDDDEGDIGYSMGDEIEVLEKVFDVLQKQKNLFDSKFRRLFENHPQRQEVLELKAKYDILMHSTGKKVVQSEAGVSKTNEQIQSALEDLANNNRSNDENESDNDGENENNDKEEAEDQESENDNSTGVDQDRQEERGDSEDNAADDHDPQETEDSEDAENGQEKKNGNGADSEDNVGWKNVEEKFLGGLVESDAVTVSLEHGEIEEINNFKDTEAITKEEELVWEYLFKEDGMMYKLYGKKKMKLDDEQKMKGKGKVATDEESETVFRNNFNLEVEKFRFKTLHYDTKVFSKVIDAWVDVLNYEEKYFNYFPVLMVQGKTSS